MELIEPRRKKSKVSCFYLFDLCHEIVKTKLHFIGKYTGTLVIIENDINVRKLYECGYFGTVSGVKYITGTKLDINTIPNENEENVKKGVTLEMTKENTLNLTLYESFFLMFALGCLKIINYDNKEYSIDECWSLFSIQDSKFIQNYIVYHYFRLKGWVVRGGEKFSGDFVLYEDGPDFTHATYIVITKVIKKFENVQIFKSWLDAIILNRIAETTNKKILVMQVNWPQNVSLTEVQKSPSFICKFTVNEMLLKRWTGQ